MPPSSRNGSPVLTVVAEGTTPVEPELEPELDVEVGASASSTVGSLVTVKVADPFDTVAPLTAWSTPFTTKSTVVADVMEGFVIVTFTGAKLPDTFVPFW